MQQPIVCFISKKIPRFHFPFIALKFLRLQSVSFSTHFIELIDEFKVLHDLLIIYNFFSFSFSPLCFHFSTRTLTSSAACVAATSRTNSSVDTNIHLPLPADIDDNVAIFSFDFIFVAWVVWTTTTTTATKMLLLKKLLLLLLRNILSRFPVFISRFCLLIVVVV